MLHLIRIDILKLQRNIPFLILSALFVLCVFGVNYIVAEVVSQIPANHSYIAFPNVWILVSYIDSYLLVIPCFVIIMHTCSEYTYRTHRQNVIDGLSRNQYVTTKILIVVALALFSTVLTFISAFVMGMSEDAAFSFENFRYIFYFFVQATAYLSFALMFALLLKKSVLTVGMFFTYSLIIENIMEMYINKIDVFGIDKIGGFLPISSSEHLLLPEQIKSMMNLANMSGSQSEYAYLIASIVYIGLCYLACYYRFQKQDL